jgi:hypothetical protein
MINSDQNISCAEVDVVKAKRNRNMALMRKYVIRLFACLDIDLDVLPKCFDALRFYV